MDKLQQRLLNLNLADLKWLKKQLKTINHSPEVLPAFCSLLAEKPSLFVGIILEQGAYAWEEQFLKASVKREALDRKSTRLNSSHIQKSRMPSSA